MGLLDFFTMRAYRTLRKHNKTVLEKEQNLRRAVLKAPKGAQFLFRRIIGKKTYDELIKRR